MLHEVGCIHCGKETFDSIQGSELCFKHYRQYNLRLTNKLKEEGKFDKRYMPKRERTLVTDHWTSQELAYWMQKHFYYCKGLRDKTIQKLTIL